MDCICENLADGLIELSPTCLRHLWIFADLKEDELMTLRKSTIRKKICKGESLFFQGDAAKELFLIKAVELDSARLSKTVLN